LSQTTTTATFAVIIPCKNAMATLEACLTALVSAGGLAGDPPMVVVDNGSTDGSLDWVSARFGDRVATLALPAVNVGALRNAGAARTSSDLVAFIDADCVVERDYFIQAATALSRSGAAMTGCYYALPLRPGRVEYTWDRLHYPSTDGPAHLIPSGNMVIERRAFDQIGGFDEALPSGEDAELCLRLIDQGGQIYQCRAVQARHLGNADTYRDFFRQQYWHALGAFGTARWTRLDRPLLLTVTHLVLVLASLGLLIGGAFPGALLGSITLILLVPGITVAYRAVSLQRHPPLVRGVALYFLYFGARISALPAAWHYRWSNRSRGTERRTGTWS
jgi:GT2 family glycosyltransferase